MKRVVIKTTYVPKLDKNQAVKITRRGGYKEKSASAAQTEIAFLLRAAMNSHKPPVRFVNAPVTVSIHVERPNEPSVQEPTADVDPVNFTDYVLDAVETGISVNDSHFQIGSLTWSINKKRPLIHIMVEQDGENMPLTLPAWAETEE